MKTMPHGAEGPTVGLTGAGGFVGREIRRALEAQGFQVRALPHAGGLPPPDAPLAEFRNALEGMHHLVHAGARNNADRRLGDAAYRGPNAVLTAKLAAAAAEILPGRMVFLSSIRAVAGARWSGTITDDMPAAPGCAYGRSKREGELAALDAFAAAPERLGILRLAPVYGVGMKGGLGALLRLADTPLPLPLAGLPGRRSLLGLEAAASAVLHLLSAPDPVSGPVIASDAASVSLAEAAAAFRDGLGRPHHIVPLLGGARWAARLVGKAGAWEALAATQVCRPERLAASGWSPPAESLSGLRAAASQRR